MNRQVSPRIIELMCSRLCHDLISPVGAVSNGLEFLSDSDPDMAADALSLVGASAKQTSDRLAFFRMAFGHGSGATKPIQQAEVQGLINGIVAEKKVSLQWACPDGDIPRPVARLILCLSLLAIETLTRGGDVTVSVLAPMETGEIRINAAGHSMSVRPDIRDALAVDTPLEMLTPRNVHAHYAALICDELERSLSVGDAEGSRVHFTVLPSS
ncbi:MAG: histidine phosphotransferase family protein [Proteobacteria bacterium]|nr:histidine phosphotransferase family protein [Pseudomonadota bacterium]